MKPIDAITGLPRSAEVAKIMSAQGRHGEVEHQGQVLSFAREMRDRQSSVNQTPKTEGGGLDTEGGSGEGGSYDGGTAGRHLQDEDKEKPADAHPGKGKILDIRGS